MANNLFLKIQQARKELKNLNIKKTGENKFSKYKYYELGDFLPHITDLQEKHKIMSVVSFGSEKATLTIYDCESEQHISFESPMSTAALKGCHEVQNLGAVQTYIRRYLYMNAFEIVESDIVDETTDTTTPKKQQLSDAQIKRLYAIASSNGISNEDVHKFIKKKYNLDSTKDLTKEQYDFTVKRMEKPA